MVTGTFLLPTQTSRGRRAFAILGCVCASFLLGCSVAGNPTISVSDDAGFEGLLAANELHGALRKAGAMHDVTVHYGGLLAWSAERGLQPINRPLEWTVSTRSDVGRCAVASDLATVLFRIRLNSSRQLPEGAVAFSHLGRKYGLTIVPPITEEGPSDPQERLDISPREFALEAVRLLAEE